MNRTSVEDRSLQGLRLRGGGGQRSSEDLEAAALDSQGRHSGSSLSRARAHQVKLRSLAGGPKEVVLLRGMGLLKGMGLLYLFQGVWLLRDRITKAPRAGSCAGEEDGQEGFCLPGVPRPFGWSTGRPWQRHARRPGAAQKS